MVRLLKTALANQDDDFDSVLTEEILAVDKQLLQVERATNEVSGMTQCHIFVGLNEVLVRKKMLEQQ